MVSPQRRPARLLIATLLFCALVATGAVASAQDDSTEDQTSEEQSGDQDAQRGKKKDKKKGRNDEPPVCEDDSPGQNAGKNGADDAAETAQGDPDVAPADGEEECVPPPRCAEGEVDLAPNADEPNCISRAQLNRLLADFEAAAAEEAAALDDLSAALEELEQLNEQLVELRLRLGEVQLRLASARADQEYAAIRQTVAGESLADVTTALESEEDRLREQAVEAYMGGDRVELATAAAVVELSGFTAQQTAREYASVIIGDQLATVDQVTALRSAVALLGEVMDEVEAEAEADAERVLSIEAAVDELVLLQRDLVTEAEVEAETIAEKIAEIQTRKLAYAEELRLRGAGGGAIGDTLRARQTGQTPPEDPFGSLGLPLEVTRIGSGFGPRVHPIFQDTRLHAGIDMSGNSGDRIIAAADGVVVQAEETGGYGNVVVVDHGNTLATLYAHMTADAVTVGQEVVEGELLGFVGSTGYSTGPHLHFEVRVLGTPVDPMLYLRFD